MANLTPKPKPPEEIVVDVLAQYSAMLHRAIAVHGYIPADDLATARIALDGKDVILTYRDRDDGDFMWDPSSKHRSSAKIPARLLTCSDEEFAAWREEAESRRKAENEARWAKKKRDKEFAERRQLLDLLHKYGAPDPLATPEGRE